MSSSLSERPSLVEKLKAEYFYRQGSRFDISTFCHPKQHSFVADQHPFATAVTSRRSGKTFGCAADLTATSLAAPRKTSLYVTLTRSNAKKIIWPVLNQINRDYRLGAEANISDLSLTYPNGSVIYLAGVNDQSQIHNFRGLALKLVYLDEAQSMRSYIQELIDDVISPALIDEAGRLRVTGTPGAVPVGYFHDIAKSPQWSHHHFTLFDNPFIEQKAGMTPQALLERELVRRGVSVNDPSIRREFYGEWALDLEALVLRYDAAINHFDALPEGHTWEHIIAVDLGFEDSDAIAVIAFSETVPMAFLVSELIKSKQGITELAGQLDVLVKTYKPLKLVMDTGGLGKKIAEEIRRRYGLPVEAADKVRKLEFVELLNDALRTGRFRAKKDSVFAQDARLLEWDRENPEKPKISDRFHSDIADAVLYGFKESLHWLHEPVAPRPKPGSKEDLDEQEREIWETAERALQADKDDQLFWSDPFDA